MAYALLRAGCGCGYAALVGQPILAAAGFKPAFGHDNVAEL